MMQHGTIGRTVSRAPRQFGRVLVRLYQYALSPLVGFECRHLPTCSAYADEALERYGLWAGGWMTLARLARCNPLGTKGLDFVPAHVPAPARWYLPWRYGRWRGVNDIAPARISQTAHDHAAAKNPAPACRAE